MSRKLVAISTHVMDVMPVFSKECHHSGDPGWIISGHSGLGAGTTAAGKGMLLSRGGEVLLCGSHKISTFVFYIKKGGGELLKDRDD